MRACSYSFPLVRLAAWTAPLGRRPRNSRTAGLFERVARIAHRALTGRSPDFQLYVAQISRKRRNSRGRRRSLLAVRCLLLATRFRARSSGRRWLPFRVRQRSRASAAAGRTTPATARRTTARTAATEIRLQQMRQRMHVVQLAVFHSKEMTVGRTAAAIGVSSAERTKDLDRSNGLVDDEAAVGDVHAARNAHIATVGRGSVAGVRAPFRTIAGIAPRDQIFLPFEKRIEVGVGRGNERGARVALTGGNDVPFLRRRVLQVVVGVEEPIARGSPEDFDLGDLVAIDTQARPKHVRLLLIRYDHFGERLTGGGV